MLHSILLGLDPSTAGLAAQALAIRWARRHGARLVGMAVLDEPGIQLSQDVLLTTSANAEARLAETRGEVLAGLRQVAREFDLRCQEAQVEFKTVQEFGTPHVRFVLEAQQHDLIVLPRHGRFEYGEEGEAGQTFRKVLEDCPRPVVAVPDRLEEGTSIVVAYDGSLQAARALYALQASGLGRSRPIHVVNADPERAEAIRHAERAVEFLRSHGVGAELHVVDASVPATEILLKMLQRLDAGLLVMGAYGEPALREFFLGSVTTTLLELSPVPVFLFH